MIFRDTLVLIPQNTIYIMIKFALNPNRQAAGQRLEQCVRYVGSKLAWQLKIKIYLHVLVYWWCQLWWCMLTCELASSCLLSCLSWPAGRWLVKRVFLSTLRVASCQMDVLGATSIEKRGLRFSNQSYSWSNPLANQLFPKTRFRFRGFLPWFHLLWPVESIPRGH